MEILNWWRSVILMIDNVRALFSSLTRFFSQTDRWQRIPMSVRIVGMLLVIGLSIVGIFNYQMLGSTAPSTYAAQNSLLRDKSILLFTPDSGYGPSRAIIVFFGNASGFSAAHRQLAAGLAGDGYVVVGVDVRVLLANLSGDSRTREEVAALRVDSLIGSSHQEFDSWPTKNSRNVSDASSHAPRKPMLLMGHALGAEFALWTAAHVSDESLKGVVAIAPTSHSALSVTQPANILVGNSDSTAAFSVADVVRAAVNLHPQMRVAFLRGSNDLSPAADTALLRAGGSHMRRFGVPMAGRSMRRIAFPSLIVRRSINWILGVPIDSIVPAKKE